MEYKIDVIGYDTCEWSHINKTITVEATTKEEAIQKAKEWCDDHSEMGGYDWSVPCAYVPQEKEVICPKCGSVSRYSGTYTVCSCCGSVLDENTKQY